MTDRVDPGAHRLPWTGRRVDSGERILGPGTWEIVDHVDCDGEGCLKAFSRGETAPVCPRCGRAVVWQLSHLAASVAADHRDSGALP